MMKNIVKLEHTVGNKVYHLLCDNDSPINEIKEALFEFLKFLGKVEDQVKAQQALAEEEKSQVDQEKPKVEELKAE